MGWTSSTQKFQENLIILVFPSHPMGYQRSRCSSSYLFLWNSTKLLLSLFPYSSSTCVLSTLLLPVLSPSPYFLSSHLLLPVFPFVPYSSSTSVLSISCYIIGHVFDDRAGNNEADYLIQLYFALRATVWAKTRHARLLGRKKGLLPTHGWRDFATFTAEA
jgi:hypothetical protein